MLDTNVVLGIVAIVCYTIVLVSMLYFGTKRHPTNPPYPSQQDLENFIGWKYKYYITSPPLLPTKDKNQEKEKE